MELYINGTPTSKDDLIPYDAWGHMIPIAVRKKSDIKERQPDSKHFCSGCSKCKPNEQ
ncbi:MAG: hypothetical protein KAS32_15990 [Candidatus Peribacteraceae bacterium]|nr:hypothetical protein [Candidatus Peribacteraceae bacterium]